jgi:hypothetical protein
VQRLLLLIVGAVVIVAAGTDSVAALQPANPCAYISATEVATIVGGPVSDGHVTTEMAPRMGESATSCLFEPIGTYVVAMPATNADFQFAAIMFLDQGTYQDSIERKPYIQSSDRVSGFGQEAYEVVSPHYEMLFVSTGKYRVGFEVAAGLGSFFGPEEGLARIVVPRLPT